MPAATIEYIAIWRGIPLSSTSSSVARFSAASSSSARRQIRRLRSCEVSFAHSPFNALRAAATARSMSSPPPSATSPSVASVAGSSTVIVSPDAASTHSPSISN